jgi:hypothetical protein
MLSESQVVRSGARVAKGGREKGPDRQTIPGPEVSEARRAAGVHPMTKDIAFTIAGPIATKRRPSPRRRAQRHRTRTMKGEGRESREGSEARAIHFRKSAGSGRSRQPVLEKQAGPADYP